MATTKARSNKRIHSLGIENTEVGSEVAGLSGIDQQIGSELPEFMHGHRKKLLFFARCLKSYAADRGLRAGEVRVLELGCGNGQNVAIPLSRLGFDVTGVDPHRPSIEFASRSSQPNLRFIASDYKSYASDDRFDQVILSDVLEHVPDPGELLTFARALLKEGGEVLISIPNGYGPYEIEQYLIRVGVLRLPLMLVRVLVRLGAAVKSWIRGRTLTAPPLAPLNLESGHIQHLTLRSFHQLLRVSGLMVSETSNGIWFGGDLSYFAFYFIPALVPLTLRIADHLPRGFVSTWYFRCSVRGD